MPGDVHSTVKRPPLCNDCTPFCYGGAFQNSVRCGHMPQARSRTNCTVVSTNVGVALQSVPTLLIHIKQSSF